MPGPLPSYTDEQFFLAIKESVSIAEVIRKLGLIPAGGNYLSIKRKIKDTKVNIDHFKGSSWRKGCKTPPKPARPLNEILTVNSRFRSSHLRKRLIKEKIKQAKCEKCNRTKWNEQPIPLELEHKNGIKDDNRIENLEILCPNCHAQTLYYRGRNIGHVAQSG